MSTATKPNHAEQNAHAWMSEIREQVSALMAAQKSGDGDAQDAATEAITEGPLSVLVRSGWFQAGDRHANRNPAEYEILLSTGGPALRIVGTLDREEPDSARLEWQDWGTLWTEARGLNSKDDEALLAYASVFYYGDET